VHTLKTRSSADRSDQNLCEDSRRLVLRRLLLRLDQAAATGDDGASGDNRKKKIIMTRIIFAAVAIMALSAGTAFADCTAEQLTAKTKAFSDKLTALAQTNAQKASEVSQKVQADSAQNPPKTLDDSCKRYDEWLAMIDKAN
jgi:hypothetical protein